MKLIFCGDSPLSTTITDSAGRALYRVQTPFTTGASTTTIARCRAPFARKRSQTIADVPYIPVGSFTKIAEIEWHTFASSKLRYKGEEVDLKEFMPKEKSGSGSGRIFTGPDGHRYRWTKTELQMVDEEQTPVALYTKHDTYARERPTLEITPECDHLSDLIVISFLYMEKSRRNSIIAIRDGGIIAAAINSGSLR